MTDAHPLLRGERRQAVIRELHKHRVGGITVAELHRAVGAAKGGLTNHLNALEEAGLLRRVRQSNGTRLVSLTSAGAEQARLLLAGGDR